MLLTVVSSGSTHCSCSFKHNASLDSLHTSPSLSALLVHISSQELPRWDTTLSWTLKASYGTGRLQDLLIRGGVFLFFFWGGVISGAHLPVCTLPRGLTTVHALDLPALSWICNCGSTSLGYSPLFQYLWVFLCLWLWFICVFKGGLRLLFVQSILSQVSSNKDIFGPFHFFLNVTELWTELKCVTFDETFILLQMFQNWLLNNSSSICIKCMVKQEQSML